MPAFAIRSIPPIHNSKSGLIGFLIKTGTFTPFNASAISCTLNGFTVVRAPTHKTSTSKCSASSTCLAVATSIATGSPVSFLACCIQGNPLVPMPSKLPGRVLGFQIPARIISTLPVAANRIAVCITCSSVSALQGPEIIKGDFFNKMLTFCCCSVKSAIFSNFNI